MTLLLNYLPYLIVALGMVMAYHIILKHGKTAKALRKLTATAIVTVVVWVMLMGLSAGYIPKTSVPRLPVPEHAVYEGESPKLENRLRTTAKPESQAQEDFDKMVEWKKDTAPKQESK